MHTEWNEKFGIDVLSVNRSERTEIPGIFTVDAAKDSLKFHAQINGYTATPLVRLTNFSKAVGVKDIFVKDESKRFWLNAFKGLGGSYAMFCILCEHMGQDPEKTDFSYFQAENVREKMKDVVFVTATDGNHGRGVSWAGGIFGCKVHVYMPAGSAETRAEAIRRVGPAEVTITGMNYDETVNYAKSMSEENGWYLIQDTAWEGYEKVPGWIIQGYLTMASESFKQLSDAGQMPTHVFLQAGVGAMAGGVLGYIASFMGDKKPVAVVAEPKSANCIYRSAHDGFSRSIEGNPVTIMAGLNCGTPCKLTWPVLRDYAEFYLSCPDYVAAEGMRQYASGKEGEKIISGESGAVTFGALNLILTRPELKEIKDVMGLNRDSVVLLFNTEGDTDPDGYRNVVDDGDYPLPAKE